MIIAKISYICFVLDMKTTCKPVKEKLVKRGPLLLNKALFPLQRTTLATDLTSRILTYLKLISKA